MAAAPTAFQAELTETEEKLTGILDFQRQCTCGTPLGV
jgi:hypothetical protein